MFTDTAFYRNANYHKMTDTAETLNYDHMAGFIEDLGPVIFELSGGQGVPEK